MTNIPGFAEFWAVYPRHVAKKAAQLSFARALKSATVEQILAGAKVYAAAQAGENPRYTKHPTTWLNGGCWDDEPAPAYVNRNGGSTNGHQRRLDAWDAALDKLGRYAAGSENLCGFGEAPAGNLPDKAGR